MKRFMLLLCLTLCMAITACGVIGSTSRNKVDYGSGKVMVLKFAANPSTGYDWIYEMDSGEDRADIVLEKQDNEFDNQMVGAGGFRTYYFRATRSGSQKITFTYRRPWEGGEIECDVVYDLNVDDELNIRCIEKKKGTAISDKDLSFFPDPVFEE